MSKGVMTYLPPLALTAAHHGCISAARQQRLWAFVVGSKEPARSACWWRL